MRDIEEIRALTHRYALLLDTATSDGIDKDGTTTLVTVLNTDTYQRGRSGWRIAHRQIKPLLPLVRGEAP